MTSAPPPMVFAWDGEALAPKAPRLADKHLVVGENYRVTIEQERSAASHNHQFAAINEAWGNLPEDLALEFPTPDHLRKYALIKCGYCDRRSVVCASKAEALRVAAFIKPMDQFAVVAVEGAVVTVYTAQSQSRRAMGGKVFNESKQAVLDVISAMIGVKPAELQHEAGRAA